ncbi:hypothetical protein BB558_007389, partial [Smittium angustum]
MAEESMKPILKAVLEKNPRDFIQEKEYALSFVTKTETMVAMFKSHSEEIAALSVKKFNNFSSRIVYVAPKDSRAPVDINSKTGKSYFKSNDFCFKCGNSGHSAKNCSGKVIGETVEDPTVFPNIDTKNQDKEEIKKLIEHTKKLTIKDSFFKQESSEILSVDSEATSCFVSEKFVKEVKLSTEETKQMSARVANGNEININKRAKFKITLDNNSLNLKAFVFPLENINVIFGFDFWKEYNVVPNYEKDKWSLEINNKKIVVKSANLEIIGRKALSKIIRRNNEKNLGKSIVSNFSEIFTNEKMSLPPEKAI